MKRSVNQARQSASRTRLALQRLENRRLMAVDIGLIDTTVSIQGSAADDVAEVYVESDRVMVKVTTLDQSGEVSTEKSDDFAVDAVDRIVFEGFDGDDVFVNDSQIDSVARGGAGNDTPMGGGGNDLLVAGNGDDLVLTGDGTDLVLRGIGATVVVDSASEASEIDSDSDESAAEEQESDDTVVDADEAPGDAEPSDEVVDEPCMFDDPEAAAQEQADLTPEDDLATTISSGESNPLPDADSSTTENEMDATDTAATPVEVISTSTQETNNARCLDIEDIPSDEQPEVDSPPDEPLDDLPNEADDQPKESDHDVIVGGLGDDWIFGGGGNDMIFGNTSPMDDALLRCIISGRLRL